MDGKTEQSCQAEEEERGGDKTKDISGYVETQSMSHKYRAGDIVHCNSNTLYVQQICLS